MTTTHTMEKTNTTQSKMATHNDAIKKNNNLTNIEKEKLAKDQDENSNDKDEKHSNPASPKVSDEVIDADEGFESVTSRKTKRQQKMQQLLQEQQQQQQQQQRNNIINSNHSKFSSPKSNSSSQNTKPVSNDRLPVNASSSSVSSAKAQNKASPSIPMSSVNQTTNNNNPNDTSMNTSAEIVEPVNVWQKRSESTIKEGEILKRDSTTAEKTAGISTINNSNNNNIAQSEKSTPAVSDSSSLATNNQNKQAKPVDNETKAVEQAKSNNISAANGTLLSEQPSATKTKAWQSTPSSPSKAQIGLKGQQAFWPTLGTEMSSASLTNAFLLNTNKQSSSQALMNGISHQNEKSSTAGDDDAELKRKPKGKWVPLPVNYIGSMSSRPERSHGGSRSAGRTDHERQSRGYVSNSAETSPHHYSSNNNSNYSSRTNNNNNSLTTTAKSMSSTSPATNIAGTKSKEPSGGSTTSESFSTNNANSVKAKKAAEPSLQTTIAKRESSREKSVSSSADAAKKPSSTDPESKTSLVGDRQNIEDISNNKNSSSDFQSSKKPVTTLLTKASNPTAALDSNKGSAETVEEHNYDSSREQNTETGQVKALHTERNSSNDNKSGEKERRRSISLPPTAGHNPTAAAFQPPGQQKHYNGNNKHYNKDHSPGSGGGYYNSYKANNNDSGYYNQYNSGRSSYYNNNNNNINSNTTTDYNSSIPHYGHKSAGYHQQQPNPFLQSQPMTLQDLTQFVNSGLGPAGALNSSANTFSSKKHQGYNKDYQSSRNYNNNSNNTPAHYNNNSYNAATSPSTYQGYMGRQSSNYNNMNSYNNQLLIGYIIAQVEYYFSTENLCKDIYFRMQMNADGYVTLATILKFNRVRSLTNSLSFLSECMSYSTMLTKDQTQTMIRREFDWKAWIFTEEQKQAYLNGIQPEIAILATKPENADLNVPETEQQQQSVESLPAEQEDSTLQSS